ncbi:MAG: NUDIX hydrolase [Francisellaceae bacterium]|jgi:8-oxo-dGTP pyrophosphatase MutT (NUDIX family)|nr:NUDIX hydrolase [Francisellaceae bacterium]MBT6208031.1 NUDIX hydrolase [Francisellaceae bacterium]MBT6538443.1 NUDIX hydrolase [Francisellaceae bacterium]
MFYSILNAVKRICCKSIKKPAVIFISVVMSGMAGYYIGLSNPSYNTSLMTISEQQKTWRLQRHVIDRKNMNRDELWVSVFKPRYTGAVAHVIAHDMNNNKDYLLITLQNRVVNGKQVLVTAPPSGFYNGTYGSSTPHAVSEEAERNIDMKNKLDLKVNHNEEYKKAKTKYLQGEIPDDNYTEDLSLIETAYRETKEETGLNLKKIEESKGNKFEIKVFDSVDVPSAYIPIYLITFNYNGLPVLEKLHGNEIIRSEWVNLSQINLEKQEISLSLGNYPIDEEVYPSTKRVVEETRAKRFKESISINDL